MRVHVMTLSQGESVAGRTDASLATYNRCVSSALTLLNQEVITCCRCPRLVVYREQIAREKRRAYRDCEYWGKPVPGLGDPQARLLILGLAPAAHGGNRTGRMFT